MEDGKESTQDLVPSETPASSGPEPGQEPETEQSTLQQIKEAYESRLAKAEAAARDAGEKYKKDLAERERMIAELINSGGSDDGAQQCGAVKIVNKKHMEMRGLN